MSELDQQKIILQATEWLIRLQEGKLSAQDLKQLELWKKQSPFHERVWSKALQLQDKISDIPSDIAFPVMRKIQNTSDAPKNKKYLWLLAIIPALSAVYYSNQQQHWMADYRSPVGERKTIELPDGGKIILNSRSAIDVNYSDKQRQIVVHKGEIWIETQKDEFSRPFIVVTQQGTAQALGTKYLVKTENNYSFVAVSEGAVKVMTKRNQQQIVDIDQNVFFNQQDILHTSAFKESDIAWTKGFLMIHDLSLADFLDRLQPYQKGLIRLDPQIANIKISGTYPIDNLDKAYQMLSQTYDLDIRHYAHGYLTHVNSKNN